MDELDRKILSELQRDADRSLEDIAAAVGSSRSPVWNRILTDSLAAESL